MFNGSAGALYLSCNRELISAGEACGKQCSNNTLTVAAVDMPVGAPIPNSVMSLWRQATLICQKAAFAAC
eukprot:7474559-Alexandrium_andersonii.AAC.1